MTDFKKMTDFRKLSGVEIPRTVEPRIPIKIYANCTVCQCDYFDIYYKSQNRL